MTKLAIIGGTGLNQIDNMDLVDRKAVENLYGKPSADIIHGRYSNTQFIFLARHGNPHTLPPHEINYRANIWALKEDGVDTIIAINAVGGITSKMKPTCLVLPDQIIDYTWGRSHTFSDNKNDELQHVDFTHPYSDVLRGKIIQTAKENNIDCVEHATYGATQGPRLETAAEIKRMENDGCDIVGMTGMPEAALAREAGIEYASISLVVNYAAGKSHEIITMDLIEHNLKQCLSRLDKLLEYLLPEFD